MQREYRGVNRGRADGRTDKANGSCGGKATRHKELHGTQSTISSRGAGRSVPQRLSRSASPISPFPRAAGLLQQCDSSSFWPPPWGLALGVVTTAPDPPRLLMEMALGW